MTPPRLATVLLRWTARRADLDFIVDDLAEEYARMIATHGKSAARRWYWRQAVGSVVPLLLDRLRRRPLAPPTPHWRVDAAQAWRALSRSPGLTATMAGTLGLALTTTLAASLLLYNVVLRPLPFPRPQELVLVYPSGPSLAASVRSLSLPDLEDLQAGASSFSALSGFSELTFTLTSQGEPRRIEGLRVGRRFAEVLGVSPAIGRAFTDSDFGAGRERVALIGSGMWRREFGASPEVIGRTLLLDDRPYTIVGVLPDVPVADVTEPHEFWVPLVARPGVFWEPVRGNGFITLIGRIAPGVTRPAAQAQLSAVARQLAEKHPQSNGNKPAVTLHPLHETVVSPVRQALLLIVLATGAVLLVACANLTNLLLAQAERRRHEFSVRLAMGAQRPHLRAQVWLETATFVGAATLVASAIAPRVAALFLQLYPESVPRSTGIGFSGLLAAGAGALFVLVTVALVLPQARRLGQVTATVSPTRTMTGSRHDRRGRATLIAVQVAFTLVLAFCGLALLRSMVRLSAVEPGFDPKGIVALSVSPSPSRFGSAPTTRVFFEQLLHAIRTVPGVRHAAVSTAVPFVNGGWRFPVPSPGGGAPTLVNVTIASAGYFETLGLGPRHGRLLTEAEHGGNQRVVMLNETAAALLPFPDVVGRTIRYAGVEWTIAGVVPAARQFGLSRPAGPELFLPWREAGRAPQRVIARIDGDPAAVMPLIRARVRELDPAAPIADVMFLEDRVQRSVAADRFRATLLACLATIGLVLAVLGVWSVTAYVVARQQRENGIRSALGESRTRLVGRTLLGTLRPALAGTVAGLLVSLWAAPLLETFLFEVRARDPLTLGAASVAVLGSAILAAILPARRALRADSVSALRAE